MKKILFAILIAVMFTVTLSAQEAKPDSTNFKKFQSDMKQLQEAVQRLDKEKYEFLGKYFENIQNIQNQYSLINMYFEQEKKRLAELTAKKKE